MDYHSYADDTQLYISLSHDNLSPINELVNCISDIKILISKNFLQLNKDKRSEREEQFQTDLTVSETQ